MKDIAITITTQEQMEIEAILLDKDKEAALAFLKGLEDRIEAVNRKQMRSPLDK
jgi:hypothetical protein